MSFSTLPFLFYFLPAFLAVYYIVPARFRNAVLALGSLLFYWLGAGTGALLVLVALILVNFAAGRLIEDAHGDERRAWLILALSRSRAMWAVSFISSTWVGFWKIWAD